MAKVDPRSGDWRYEPGELDAQFAEASRRAEEAVAAEPRALAVRFEAEGRKFVLDLNNGASFIFPADRCQGLQGATAAALAEVELTALGTALHWEKLDADLSVAGLLMGVFGGQSWMKRLREELARESAARPTKPRSSTTGGTKDKPARKAAGS